MRILLYCATFLFLGVLAPVFLIAGATTWDFARILAAWGALALLSLPFFWALLRKKSGAAGRG